MKLGVIPSKQGRAAMETMLGQRQVSDVNE